MNGDGRRVVTQSQGIGSSRHARSSKMPPGTRDQRGLRAAPPCHRSGDTRLTPQPARYRCCRHPTALQAPRPLASDTEPAPGRTSGRTGARYRASPRTSSSAPTQRPAPRARIRCARRGSCAVGANQRQARALCLKRLHLIRVTQCCDHFMVCHRLARKSKHGHRPGRCPDPIVKRWG